MNNSLQIVR